MRTTWLIALKYSHYSHSFLWTFLCIRPLLSVPIIICPGCPANASAMTHKAYCSNLCPYVHTNKVIFPLFLCVGSLSSSQWIATFDPQRIITQHNTVLLALRSLFSNFQHIVLVLHPHILWVTFINCSNSHSMSSVFSKKVLINHHNIARQPITSGLRCIFSKGGEVLIILYRIIDLAKPDKVVKITLCQ